MLDLTRVKRPLARFLYRYSWSTRLRNGSVASEVAGMLKGPDGRTTRGRFQLLDAGSGAEGVAAFLPPVSLVTTDLSPPTYAGEAPFVRADITSLPFRDRSFQVATSVDVLEHLPREIRPRAIAELVRVASDGVVLAFPQGEPARSCDAEHRLALEKRRRPVPDWLLEHQMNPYPEGDAACAQIMESARSAGRAVDLRVAYSEPVRIARLVRSSAGLSEIAYIFTNLAAGVLLGKVRARSAADAYRIVISASFG